jgi:hypothetical protein
MNASKKQKPESATSRHASLWIGTAGERTQGAPEARHLLHPRSLARTPAPWPGAMYSGAWSQAARSPIWAGRALRRAGRIAAYVVTVSPLDCRQWPSCHFSCRKPGASGDAAQRADLRAGDYAPYRVDLCQGANAPELRRSCCFADGTVSSHSIFGRRNTAHSGGKLTPIFYDRAGEILPLPPQFEEAIRKLTAHVCCIGCKHTHLGVPPVIGG